VLISAADGSTEGEFVVRTATANDQPDTKSFATVDSAHHALSVQLITVANSVDTDKHEDHVTAAECGAMAEREAKRRRVEWKAKGKGDEEGEAELVGVRDEGGDLIDKDQIEDESQFATLRGQVGLGQTQAGTQLELGDEWQDFDQTGPSSLDHVALARQVSTSPSRQVIFRTQVLTTCSSVHRTSN
jgi:hypothetical protein